MVDNLVGQAAVVLENVILLRASSNSDLLSNLQSIDEVLIRDIVQTWRMELGDHKAVTLRARSNVLSVCNAPRNA